MANKLLRSYYDFLGGLNTDAAIDNLADNELVQADNVDLLERGGMMKRKGTRRLNETTYGAQVEQLIEWGRDSGETWLLAVIGDNLCKLDATTHAPTVLATVASSKIGFFVLQDKLYFVDGSNYRVYDGTTVSNVMVASEDDASDLTTIKRCKYIVRHTNSYRMFAAGDSNDPTALYYSEPNEPGYWKEVAVLHPTTGDGPVTGLAHFGEALLVFYRNSIWAWQGAVVEYATWSKLPTGVGTTAADTITLTPGSLVFLGQSGIYAISPGVIGYDVTVEPTEGMVANLAKNKVERLIRSIAVPEIATAVFDSHNQRYMLAYTDPESARNNRVLVFDWGIGAFTRYTGLQINDFLQRLDGTLLAATNGYVLQMGIGYDDNDTPVELDIRTKNFNLDHPFHKKNFLRLYISFRQPEQGTSELTLRLYVDDILRHEILEAALYENFVWGTGYWGEIWGFRSNVTTRTRIYGSGHRVQMRFSNKQADDPTTIYGLAFEFRPKRAKGRLL